MFLNGLGILAVTQKKRKSEATTERVGIFFFILTFLQSSTQTLSGRKATTSRSWGRKRKQLNEITLPFTR